MTREPRESNHAKSVKPRLWPGMIASVLIVIGLPLGILLNLAMPNTAFIGMLLALVGGLATLIWWLFFSRVRWSERLGALAVLIAAWFAMRPFLDKSILGGAMGGLPFFTLSVFGVALFFWAWRTRNLSNGIRVVSLVAAMLIAGGLCTLVKTEGLRGGFFQFHWRWTPTPEELLVAQGDEDPLPISPTPTSDVPREPTAAKAAGSVTSSPVVPAPGKAPDWPGFRGPDRDGIVHIQPIETDWAKSPPMELWRQPIGPGWSSIAVDGDFLYTQEQRGDNEIIAAYQLNTGKPVWRHRDAARFYESNGGPGPRGTPTVFNGRVYAFGGTGILNALNAGTGAVLWSRNV